MTSLRAVYLVPVPGTRLPGGTATPVKVMCSQIHDKQYFLWKGQLLYEQIRINPVFLILYQVYLSNVVQFDWAAQSDS